MTKKKVMNKSGNGKKLFWNIVKGMAAVLALMGAFYTIDARFAKSADLQKQEQSTVKTLEMFQNKMEYKFLRDRVDTLNDQKRQLRLMMKKTPNDVELQDQYNEIDQEIRTIKVKLTELEKK